MRHMRKQQRRLLLGRLSVAPCAGIVSAAISSASLRYSASAEPPPETATFQEQVIGEMTAGSEFKGGRADKEHLAWIEKQGGKRTVRLDGKPQGGTYDDVR